MPAIRLFVTAPLARNLSAKPEASKRLADPVAKPARDNHAGEPALRQRDIACNRSERGRQNRSTAAAARLSSPLVRWLQDIDPHRISGTLRCSSAASAW